MKRLLIVPALLLGLAAGPALAGDRTERAVLGAGIGGALGALIGNEVSGRDGALLGGAIGAATGVAIGSREHRRDDHRYRDRRVHRDYRHQAPPRFRGAPPGHYVRWDRGHGHRHGHDRRGRGEYRYRERHRDDHRRHERRYRYRDDD